MGVTVTRTTVVKSLSEYFWYAVLDDTTPPSIVGARRVVQRIGMTGAATAEETILAARGAGFTAAAHKPYAVALTAIRSALVITLDAKALTFEAGDPPGTAVTNVDDSAVDIGATPTYGTGTSGDQIALVAQPPFIH